VRLIETDRVLIRQFEIADFEVYCALWDDADVRQNFRVDNERARAWKNRQRFERICSAAEPNEFAVVEAQNGTVFGRAQISHAVDFGSLSVKDFEVMVALLPSARGRGTGQETTAALIEYLCEARGAEKIFAKVVPGNSKSEEMALRLGFTKDSNIASSRDPGAIVLVLSRESWKISDARMRLLA
jgi:RimJ/RimL family protein N-acetyltransferase